jgi:hypothetical protein
VEAEAVEIPKTQGRQGHPRRLPDFGEAAKSGKRCVQGMNPCLELVD